jgi:hypothetical protein
LQEVFLTILSLNFQNHPEGIDYYSLKIKFREILQCSKVRDSDVMEVGIVSSVHATHLVLTQGMNLVCAEWTSYIIVKMLGPCLLYSLP